MPRPTLDNMPLGEAAEMLEGVTRVNQLQLAGGMPGITMALQRGVVGGTRDGRRLRYIRHDPTERWQTIRGIWRRGGGDCEDLAAAVAAEIRHRGGQADPVIYRVRPGLAHVIVRARDRLGQVEYLDPSRWGGMGEDG